MEIRRTDINDLNLYFEWANDDLTRANSINQEKILYENHVKWFTEKLKDKNSILYIISDENSYIGQLRFELKNDGRYHIDHSVDFNMRGKGLSKKMLELSLNELKKEIKSGELLATIREDNLPSLKTYKGYGFKEVEDVIIKNRKYKNLIFNI